MIQEIILTKEECNSILSQVGEYTRGHITYDGVSSEISDMRTCYEYTFVNNQEITNLIFSKIEKFGIKSLPSELTVVRYEVGQGFDSHVDAASGHEDRIKTVSIQLTEFDEYKGGEFIVWEFNEELNCEYQRLVKMDIGNLVIFDSLYSHYVSNVLEGTRYGLVFWLSEENLI